MTTSTTTTTTTTTTMSKIKDNPIPEEQADSNISLTPTSQVSSLFLPNGSSHPKFLEFCDIEMISFHSLTYTSLKDIIRPSDRSPPQGIMSPTHNSSWHEIPIKNPLVKQAALAYLQPMSFPPESDERGFFTKLIEKCGCGGDGDGGGGNGGYTGRFGCLAYFAEVVVRSIKHAFRENVDYDDEDYDSDDDDDEDDKVD